MSNNLDYEGWRDGYSYDLETLYSKHGNPIYKQKERKVFVTTEQLKNNKFYIGSNSIFKRADRAGGGWGHKTLDEAISHAQEMLAMDDSSAEVFIVEIVRVVKKKKIEVDVEVI